jgi:uncharacterized iron-regulated membrane protein
VVNGTASLALIVLFFSGLVVWWPGITRWTRGLVVDFRSGSWKRINWDLHGVTGFWLFGLLMLWAVTGVEFAFPSQFRAAVNAVSPLTVTPLPMSTPQESGAAEADTTDLAARSLDRVAGAALARIVLPSTPESITGAVSPATQVQGQTLRALLDISVDEPRTLVYRVTREAKPEASGQGLCGAEETNFVVVWEPAGPGEPVMKILGVMGGAPGAAGARACPMLEYRRS